MLSFENRLTAPQAEKAMAAPETTKIADALLRALRRMLRPLVRVLLRYGVSYKAFEDVARRVFIDVATDDFAVPGRKLSASRIAVLTGLSRHDVARYREQPLPHEREDETRVNRAARVISGWRSDPAFHGKGGKPAALPLEEGSPSFAELVKRYAGDIPTRALLDELIRIGAVSKLASGDVKLESRAYVPGGGNVDTVAILGSHVPELIETIDHNLECEPDDTFFQRRVFCADVPVEAADKIRGSVARQGQALLEQLHGELMNSAYAPTGRVKRPAAAKSKTATKKNEASTPPEAPQTVRVVLGMHYLETPDDDDA